MRAMIGESLQPSASVSWAMRLNVRSIVARRNKILSLRLIRSGPFVAKQFTRNCGPCGPSPWIAITLGRKSHPVVIRSAPTFRRHPGDDLVRVGNVAGFAMDAVRRIQADALAVRLGRVIHHFVYVRGTEILAGTAILLHAALVANVRIVNDEMRRLILFVLGTRMIKVGELVENELAIVPRRSQQVGFIAAIG